MTFASPGKRVRAAPGSARGGGYDRPPPSPALSLASKYFFAEAHQRIDRPPPPLPPALTTLRSPPCDRPSAVVSISQSSLCVAEGRAAAKASWRGASGRPRWPGASSLAPSWTRTQRAQSPGRGSIGGARNVARSRPSASRGKLHRVSHAACMAAPRASRPTPASRRRPKKR